MLITMKFGAKSTLLAHIYVPNLDKIRDGVGTVAPKMTFW